MDGSTRPGNRALLLRLLDRSWVWAAVGLVIVFGAIVGLQRTREHADQTELALETYTEFFMRLETLNLLVEHAFEDGTASESELNQGMQEATRVALSLRDLLRLKPDDEATRELDATAKNYWTALDSEFARLLSGQAGSTGGPSALTTATEAVAEAGTRAESGYQDELKLANRLALVAQPVTLLVILLVVGALMWKVQQGQRAAERLRAEQQLLRASEQRFRSLVQHTQDAILLVDADGAVQYASAAAEGVWGERPSTLERRSAVGLVATEDRAAMLALLNQVRTRTETVSSEFRALHRDGSHRHLKVVAANLLTDPGLRGILLTCQDQTERKAFERQLTQLAFHDGLTDLPNRALFQDRLEHALARGQERGYAVTLMFLDLDNFKVVNDSLGHAVGDELLKVVAARLQARVTVEDTVARMGGDEFTVLLDRPLDEAAALALAETILADLKEPVLLEGREMVVHASIGIARSGQGAERPDSLLRNADLAMYGAKERGKCRAQMFDPAMNVEILERLDLEADLRRALEADEFRLVYQPIVALNSGQLREVEALVRWQHPTRGMVSPAQFIPIAEETGLIVDLGLWVLATACRQAQAWRSAFPNSPPLLISVNLSARQFQHQGLVAEITRVIEETGLRPELLKLEITESVVMEDAETTVATLQALKDLGVRLAIDDFGTGYSSLGYLKRFPVDTLKIDHSFVDGLGQDVNDSAIVRSVVALAKSMNLQVTGEGVETAEQWQHLRALGCDQGQGYLWSRPLTPEAVADLLTGATTLAGLDVEFIEAAA